jgi:hypothetical protein
MKRVQSVLMLAAIIGVLGPRPSSAADTPGEVTFSKDVAPILQKSCQSCHHPGTAAPMSLMTYQDARPWAKAIRQRVAAREMPPWHLDKTVGIRKYKNDISLSDKEIATLVQWVDGGAKQGDPKLLPAPLTFKPDDEWFIGKPDLVATFDKQHVMYANGPDWWIYKFAELNLTEDRWVKAVQIKPGNPKIVHHAVAYIFDEDHPDDPWSLNEYAAGKYGDNFGDAGGVLLKAGSRVRFDMHYFAIGEEERDQTSIGIIFHPKGYVPKLQVQQLNFRNLPNDELEIPPNSVVRHDGYLRLTKNARIAIFQPHMHMRGKAMTLEAINLDNTVTVLSSVDRFDFGWHISYIYEDDVAPLLPAGTMLHIVGIHDNTPSNRRNPDPEMWAGYGERSVDDMLQVRLHVTYLSDAEFKQAVEERKASRRGSPTEQHQQ